MPQFTPKNTSIIGSKKLISYISTKVGKEHKTLFTCPTNVQRLCAMSSLSLMAVLIICPRYIYSICENVCRPIYVWCIVLGGCWQGSKCCQGGVQTWLHLAADECVSKRSSTAQVGGSHRQRQGASCCMFPISYCKSLSLLTLARLVIR